MAKISLIVAMVVTLLTAVLAVKTKSNAVNLQTSLSDSKKSLAAAQATVNKKESELKKAAEEVSTAAKAADDAKAAASKAIADTEAAKKGQADAESKLKESDEKIAAVNAELEKIKGSTGATMTAEEVAAKVNALQKERDDLKVEVDEQKKVADTLRSKDTEQTGKFTALEQKVMHYEKEVALHSFSGNVTAVNPGWNFVVLNVGDRRGATPNSTVIISRGGAMIAKARITSVEPDQSIADVIAGSLPRGVTIQPGDQVVFSGTRPAGGPAGASAPGSASNAPARH